MPHTVLKTWQPLSRLTPIMLWSNWYSLSSGNKFRDTKYPIFWLGKKLEGQDSDVVPMQVKPVVFTSLRSWLAGTLPGSSDRQRPGRAPSVAHWTEQQRRGKHEMKQVNWHLLPLTPSWSHIKFIFNMKYYSSIQHGMALKGFSLKGHLGGTVSGVSDSWFPLG